MPILEKSAGVTALEKYFIIKRFTNIMHHDEFLEKLKDTEKLIIVEGRKDKAALVNLGVTADILFVNMPLYKLAELVAKRTKKAVILTDLDSSGKKLYKELKTLLTANGVEVDNYFREYLFKNTELAHIEGIDSYFERIS